MSYYYVLKVFVLEVYGLFIHSVLVTQIIVALENLKNIRNENEQRKLGCPKRSIDL